jgi:hypothetical protein
MLPKNGSPLGPGRSSNVRFATIRPGLRARSETWAEVKKEFAWVSPLFSACWHEPEPVLLRAEGEDPAKGAAHRRN